MRLFSFKVSKYCVYKEPYFVSGAREFSYRVLSLKNRLFCKTSFLSKPLNFTPNKQNDPPLAVCTLTFCARP